MPPETPRDSRRPRAVGPDDGPRWYWSEQTAQEAILERCDPEVRAMACCKGVGRVVRLFDGTAAYTHLVFSVVWNDPDGEEGIASASGHLYVHARDAFTLVPRREPDGRRPTLLPLRGLAPAGRAGPWRRCCTYGA